MQFTSYKDRWIELRVHDVGRLKLMLSFRELQVTEENPYVDDVNRVMCLVFGVRPGYASFMAQLRDTTQHSQPSNRGRRLLAVVRISLGYCKTRGKLMRASLRIGISKLTHMSSQI